MYYGNICAFLLIHEINKKTFHKFKSLESLNYIKY